MYISVFFLLFTSSTIYCMDKTTIAEHKKELLTIVPIETRTFFVDSDPINNMAFSHDGTLLASLSKNTVRLTESKTGNYKNALILYDSREALLCADFNAHNSLVAGSSNGKLYVWNDINNNKYTFCFNGHTEQINDICFSNNGTLLVSASNDNTIRIWDCKSGACIGTITQKHPCTICCMHKTTSFMYAAINKQELTTYHINVMKNCSYYIDPIHGIYMSPDDKYIALASNNHIILRHHPTHAQKTLTEHNQKVRDIDFAHNDTLFASTAFDHTIRLWDRSLESSLRIINTESYIQQVQFNPADYNTLVGINYNKILKYDLTLFNAVRNGTIDAQTFTTALALVTKKKKSDKRYKKNIHNLFSGCMVQQK